ncbi:MAG: crotonase/enoyl-CoA hydratase family protein [Pseudomonadota bacterium]
MEYQQQDNIGVISFDDGKVNAVNPDFVNGFMGHLDTAEKDAQAIVITGRDGMFSAGYDLKIIEADPKAGRAMIQQGMELVYRLYSFPMPVIAACDGHAIGLGAFLLMSSDTRIGSEGDYKVQLPETAISMPFNTLLLELAQARLKRQEHVKRILQSVPCSPTEAVTAGFLDELVEKSALHMVALETAKALAALPSKFYIKNKLDLRADSLKRMQQDL